MYFFAYLMIKFQDSLQNSGPKSLLVFMASVFMLVTKEMAKGVAIPDICSRLTVSILFFDHGDAEVSEIIISEWYSICRISPGSSG